MGRDDVPYASDDDGDAYTDDDGDAYAYGSDGGGEGVDDADVAGGSRSPRYAFANFLDCDYYLPPKVMAHRPAPTAPHHVQHADLGVAPAAVAAPGVPPVAIAVGFLFRIPRDARAAEYIPYYQCVVRGAIGSRWDVLVFPTIGFSADNGAQLTGTFNPMTTGEIRACHAATTASHGIRQYTDVESWLAFIRAKRFQWGGALMV